MIFERESTIIIFRAWTSVWTTVREIRIFKKAIISQLLMYVVWLNTLMSTFFDLIKLVLINMLIFKLLIKWIFLIIIVLTKLLFLFLFGKYMKTIIYFFDECLFDFTLRTKIENVMIRTETFEIWIFANCVLKRIILALMFKYIDWILTINDKAIWIWI